MPCTKEGNCDGGCKQGRGACPCLFTTPCDGCTCVQPFSSSGCRRCCSYGSLEQRQSMAEYLAHAIDSYNGKL